MIKIKKIDKIVSIKFKRQRGFHLFELIVILAAIAIIAAVCTLLIYIGYKLLGKAGAIGMLVIQVFILALANDMLPFIEVY